MAKELGIERVFAEALPADRARHVRETQEEGKFVAMVGDGVNDTPALPQANTGIATGSGTGVAIETASVVSMKDDPVLAIPIAAGVLYPSLRLELRPEWAALLMSASSTIVATNAVVLKRAEQDLVEA